MTLAITNVGRWVIAEPAKAAWEHGNQALVTSAAAFMSAMFSMQHDVLPIWIAVPLAIGFELTYLRGIAQADKTMKSGWATALNWAAMLTSVVYGMLFVLGHYGVISPQPDNWTAVGLATAHVLPMALLSFCGANLRRIQKQEELAHRLRLVAEEEDRNRRLAEEEEVRNRKLRAAEDELRIEMARKEAELALFTKAKVATAQAKMEVAQLGECNKGRAWVTGRAFSFRKAVTII